MGKRKTQTEAKKESKSSATKKSGKRIKIKGISNNNFFMERYGTGGYSYHRLFYTRGSLLSWGVVR